MRPTTFDDVFAVAYAPRQQSHFLDVPIGGKPKVEARHGFLVHPLNVKQKNT